MSILDSFNAFSKTLLGIGIIDAWHQAAQTKVASQKSAQLAQNKHLREAITIAEKALAIWSQKPGFWERLICQLVLGKILDEIKQQLQQWRRQVAEANKLAANAKTLLKQDTGDPLQTQALSSAIALYERCSQIIQDERLSQLIKQYQQELQRRQQFQVLVKQADSHAEQGFFKNAIAAYHEAEKLYSTETLRQAISAAEVKLIKQHQQELQRRQQFQVLVKQADSHAEQGFFKNAIALYREAEKLYSTETLKQAISAAEVKLIKQYQQELQRRQQFQVLVKQADSHAEQGFFKNAIAAYREAEKLYSTETLRQAISTAQVKVKAEEIYDATLKRAKQAQSEGKLRSAIALLENALANFTRADGLDLLQSLQRTVKGKVLFRQGLAAEKAGYFPVSASLYENAKFFLPDITECQIRLGIVAIKNQDWTTALSYLEGLPTEQAAYLRGFVYAQQENLQLADREWQSLSSTIINQQREILKSLSQRKRLLSLQNIEHLVKADKLDEAKTASTEFIDKFGYEQLVEENLNLHIQPRLEAKFWQSSSWITIVNHVENLWRVQPNITTLHNWAVASYYHAQSDSTKLSNAITALSTALANITHDPTLQDVPWLGKKVDYASVSLELKRRLEAAVDTLKDTNLNDYLNLRDHFRLELVALRLMGEPVTQGMMVNGLYLTPFCYNHYLFYWLDILLDRIHTSQNILRFLYTSWGLSIAAFIEGDSQRAIQIQPARNPSSEIENFAQKFVAYHQGCYQLQQQKWREAIILFQQAISEIKTNQHWQQEIDRLCGLQRQAISEFTEHLQFAQSWYELLNSNSAASYLAEYKAEKIREQLVEKQISLEKALKELQVIKQIDTQNPIVIDLIERVEFQQEMEVIEKLLKNDQFEEAVQHAKKSQHQRIRHIVAEICIEILIKGIENRNLPFEIVQKLGLWAYQLCPYEPAFQQIFRSLNLR